MNGTLEIAIGVGRKRKFVLAKDGMTNYYDPLAPWRLKSPSSTAQNQTLLFVFHQPLRNHIPIMTSQKTSKASLGHVLVTGGCGFLGSNIVSLLLSRYPESTVSVIDIRTNLNRLESPKVSYHNCDITDLSAVREIFQKVKPDVVIHTAATVPNGLIKDAVMYAVNVNGTKNLLAAARELDTKAFVYTSSASVVVGHVNEVIRADENWPVVVGKDQPEYYSNTKVRQTRRVGQLSRELIMTP
jgi:sterol-4alpha-carboxylate 3-dehydrogenase (decarboxylating)